jgi:hypothetical protein
MACPESIEGAALRRRLSTGDDLQGAACLPEHRQATVRAVFNVDIKTHFEQSGPAHARRRALRVSVFARALGGTLCRSRKIRQVSYPGLTDN